jgi:hypothetical protein
MEFQSSEEALAVQEEIKVVLEARAERLRTMPNAGEETKKSL